LGYKWPKKLLQRIAKIITFLNALNKALGLTIIITVVINSLKNSLIFSEKRCLMGAELKQKRGVYFQQ